MQHLYKINAANSKIVITSKLIKSDLSKKVKVPHFELHVFSNMRV